MLWSKLIVKSGEVDDSIVCMFLQEYREQFQSVDTRRHDLLSAERLFNLPVSACTELLKVQHEMQALEKIYAIFNEFVVRPITPVPLKLSP